MMMMMMIDLKIVNALQGDQRDLDLVWKVTGDEKPQGMSHWNMLSVRQQRICGIMVNKTRNTKIMWHKTTRQCMEKCMIRE